MTDHRWRRSPRILAPIATALLAAACTALPSPTAVPRSADTVIATADPTVPPSLRVDGLATVAADDVIVWDDPGVQPTRQTPSKLERTTLVYVSEGPKHADGADWWRVQPETNGQFRPFGWVPATDADGWPALAPFAPLCPSSEQPIRGAVFRDLGTLTALACFGGAEITLEGLVTCSPINGDGGAGGASWLDIYSSCIIDDALALHGPAVTALLTGPLPPDPVSGQFRVVGHFDDPEAQVCSWFGVGVSLDRPGGPLEPSAVIACRQDFVVATVRRLG